MSSLTRNPSVHGPALTRLIQQRSNSLQVVLDCFPPDLIQQLDALACKQIPPAKLKQYLRGSTPEQRAFVYCNAQERNGFDPFAGVL